MKNTISRDQIRKQIRVLRRSLSTQQQAVDAEKLSLRLSGLDKIQKSQKIAISLAFDGEIQTMPFIEWCWQHNKQVYLPVLHPFSKGNLMFLQYTASTEMITNKYGILEPKLNQQLVCPTSQLDVIFTPLVAFDKQGNRIGMGGGYYDRTLSTWFKHQTGPYPIGLAHDCQLVEQLPIESWDVPLPEIITPAKHHLFNTKN